MFKNKVIQMKLVKDPQPEVTPDDVFVPQDAADLVDAAQDTIRVIGKTAAELCTHATWCAIVLHVVKTKIK